MSLSYCWPATRVWALFLTTKKFFKDLLDDSRFLHDHKKAYWDSLDVKRSIQTTKCSTRPGTIFAKMVRLEFCKWFGNSFVFKTKLGTCKEGGPSATDITIRIPSSWEQSPPCQVNNYTRKMPGRHPLCISVLVANFNHMNFWSEDVWMLVWCILTNPWALKKDMKVLNGNWTRQYYNLNISCLGILLQSNNLNALCFEFVL